MNEDIFEAIEDEIDLQAATDAMKDGGELISWDDLKHELGL